MARALLVSFAGFPLTACSLFPDNGLAVLAGSLIARGHEVKILDFNTVRTVDRSVPPDRTTALAAVMPLLGGALEPELLERLLEIEACLGADLERAADAISDEIAAEIRRQRSDFVGFKLWSGDGFAASVRIARALRDRFPELKVYGGGPAVLYAEHSIYDLTDVFDALVDGEGEEAIVGLAEHADGRGDLASVPNLIVKVDGVVHRTRRSRLTDPFHYAIPVYDPQVYPSLEGDDQIHVFVLEESRGCPNGCPFCIHKNASGERWRSSAPEDFVERAQAIFDRFGVDTFRFGGSNTPPQFLDDVANVIIAQGVRARFSGFCHASNVGRVDLGRLAEAGCAALFTGIESFHPRDLERLGKGAIAPITSDAVRRCIETGIVPGISLIVPCPGGSSESLRVNHDAVVELCTRAPSSVMVTIPALIPRTRWWESRAENGFDLLVSEDEYRRILATYRIRLIIPPSLWDPLPYTLDGRTFAECAAESARFQQCLAREGVTLNVQDEAVLLADVMDVSLPAIRDTIRDLFFTLDAQKIRAFVTDVNGTLKAR